MFVLEKIMIYIKKCVEKKDNVDCNIFTWSNAEEIIEVLQKFC